MVRLSARSYWWRIYEVVRIALTCIVCEAEFERKGSRGPIPKYCGPTCASVPKRANPQRKEYERLYKRSARASGKLRAYERAYYQRPEVKQRYRQRYYDIIRDPFMDIEIAAPYAGHMWFDKIKELVGPMPDQTKPWSDKWNDEMGEAVLAFLEGRNPQEGLTKVRRDYNMMQYRQVYISHLEFADNERGGSWEKLIVQPDVEPEEPSIIYEPAIRVDWATNSRRGLHAGKRKGSRGPNRSHKKFRGNHGDSDERWR